ncbi:MAG: hypothetical protein ACTTI3_01035 [Treponema sp.]
MMKRIFKYTLLQRVPYIMRYNGILLGIVCIELLLLKGTNSVSGFSALWLMITIGALIGLPIFLLIHGSSGYAQQLLFTNESYLMLTLPVSGKATILGRMLAGFVEFIVCTIFSCLLTIVIIMSQAFRFGDSVFTRRGDIGDILFVIAQNYKLILVGVFIFCVAFCFVGTVMLFVRTMLRSFAAAWRKGIVSLCSIFICALIIFLIGRIEQGITKVFNLHFYVTSYGWYYSDGMRKIQTMRSFEIPLIAMLTALAFSVVFFFLSAKLLEDYIEV